MGAKICVLLNCGQQSQFSKVRREFDAGRVNLDPPMTCADWPVPGNLTLLHAPPGIVSAERNEIVVNCVHASAGSHDLWHSHKLNVNVLRAEG